MGIAAPICSQNMEC